MRHSSKLSLTSGQKARFATMAVLASGIFASCNLPKEERPMNYPSPDCSDMNMSADEIDKCRLAKETYVTLYPPTAPIVIVEAQKDAGTVKIVEIAPGCLEKMSRVGPFCIDQYENYVVEISAGNEIVHPFFELLQKGKQYVAKTEKGVFPQGYISGEQAEDACKNAGKRLCTIQEWRSACMGSMGLAYGYGPEQVSNKCNVGRIWQPGVLFGKGPYNLNDPRLNQLPGGLTKTGDYPECTSDHKVYDMLGNEHEWVSTRVDASMIYGGGKTNIPGVVEVPGNGMFAGGFYTNNPSCNYATKSHPFSHYDYSTGFRCCMDPKH